VTLLLELKIKIFYPSNILRQIQSDRYYIKLFQDDEFTFMIGASEALIPLSMRDGYGVPKFGRCFQNAVALRGKVLPISHGPTYTNEEDVNLHKISYLCSQSMLVFL
jgi:hypothetical protein